MSDATSVEALIDKAKKVFQNCKLAKAGATDQTLRAKRKDFSAEIAALSAKGDEVDQKILKREGGSRILQDCLDSLEQQRAAARVADGSAQPPGATVGTASKGPAYRGSTSSAGNNGDNAQPSAPANGKRPAPAPAPVPTTAASKEPAHGAQRPPSSSPIRPSSPRRAVAADATSIEATIDEAKKVFQNKLTEEDAHVQTLRAKREHISAECAKLSAELQKIDKDILISRTLKVCLDSLEQQRAAAREADGSAQPPEAAAGMMLPRRVHLGAPSSAGGDGENPEPSAPANANGKRPAAAPALANAPALTAPASKKPALADGSLADTRSMSTQGVIGAGALVHMATAAPAQDSKFGGAPRCGAPATEDASEEEAEMDNREEAVADETDVSGAPGRARSGKEPKCEALSEDETKDFCAAFDFNLAAKKFDSVTEFQMYAGAKGKTASDWLIVSADSPAKALKAAFKQYSNDPHKVAYNLVPFLKLGRAPARKCINIGDASDRQKDGNIIYKVNAQAAGLTSRIYYAAVASINANENKWRVRFSQLPLKYAA